MFIKVDINEIVFLKLVLINSFSSIMQVSEIFDGKEICVVNGPSRCPKSEIEKRVAEFGGSIVQNPGDTIKPQWQVYCNELA